MSKSFQIEGIGAVDVIEKSEEFSLYVQLSDMHISRAIKFYSPDLLKEFFQSLSENNVKEMAMATLRNRIELSARKVSLRK